MKDELTITCKRCNKVRILVMDTNKISMCSCGAAVCPYCGSTFYKAHKRKPNPLGLG